MGASEADDTVRENHRVLFGSERTILPGSFFESKEWRSWAACRRPQGAVWDEGRAAQALLQRTMAHTFQLQYQYEAAALIEGLGARAATRKRATEALASIEAQACASMKKFDVRKDS